MGPAQDTIIGLGAFVGILVWVFLILLAISPFLIWLRQKALRDDQAKQLCYLQERTEKRLADLLAELKKVNEKLDRLTVVDDDESDY